jgi:hypothetical protein
MPEQNSSHSRNSKAVDSIERLQQQKGRHQRKRQMEHQGTPTSGIREPVETPLKEGMLTIAGKPATTARTPTTAEMPPTHRRPETLETPAAESGVNSIRNGGRDFSHSREFRDVKSSKNNSNSRNASKSRDHDDNSRRQQ